MMMWFLAVLAVIAIFGAILGLIYFTCWLDSWEIHPVVDCAIGIVIAGFIFACLVVGFHGVLIGG